MEIKWKNYKDEKPTEEGIYLWAQNHWDTKNYKGQRVFTGSVRTAYWKSARFWDGTHGLIDPNQWAEIPCPPKAKRPLDDLIYEI